MTTAILSAVCAIALGSSVMADQADTVNVYVINGVKVENFDGSQLVGETVSDYSMMTSTSTCNGVATVTKMHLIRTDGKLTGRISSCMATTGNGDSGNAAQITIVGSDDFTDVTVIPGADEIEVFVDGKKSSMEKLGKIKPEKISSMTVYKSGSEEAAKWTKRTNGKDKDVIVIELKK